MTRRDAALVIVGCILAVLVICEAEAQEVPEPRCDTPVLDWPTEPPVRTCGEWRCLTRRAWAEQVMQPERDLTLCARRLRASSTYSAELEAAHREAVADAIEARREADRVRRRRWQYVTVGAIIGASLTAGVTYGAVRVLEAR